MESYKDEDVRKLDPLLVWASRRGKLGCFPAPADLYESVEEKKSRAFKMGNPGPERK